MGRLVTRAQLQSAANQIGAHILGVMQKLEDAHEARLARIEKFLGLPPIDAKPPAQPWARLHVERRLELVEADCSAPQSEVDAIQETLDQPKESA